MYIPAAVPAPARAYAAVPATTPATVPALPCPLTAVLVVAAPMWRSSSRPRRGLHCRSRAPIVVRVVMAAQESLLRPRRGRRSHRRRGYVGVVVVSVVAGMQSSSSSWLRGGPRRCHPGRVGVLVIAAATWGPSSQPSSLPRVSVSNANNAQGRVFETIKRYTVNEHDVDFSTSSTRRVASIGFTKAVLPQPAEPEMYKMGSAALESGPELMNAEMKLVMSYRSRRRPATYPELLHRKT